MPTCVVGVLPTYVQKKSVRWTVFLERFVAASDNPLIREGGNEAGPPTGNCPDADNVWTLVEVVANRMSTSMLCQVHGWTRAAHRMLPLKRSGSSGKSYPATQTG